MRRAADALHTADAARQMPPKVTPSASSHARTQTDQRRRGMNRRNGHAPPKPDFTPLLKISWMRAPAGMP